MDYGKEIDDLIRMYSLDTVREAFNAWQNDDTKHPMTCINGHGPLAWQDNMLVCWRNRCFYHQHWMPVVIVENYILNYAQYNRKG